MSQHSVKALTFNSMNHVEEYKKLYSESIKEPEKFWAEIAEKEIQWSKKWDKTFEWNYPDYKWFVGGKLNITQNCLDRHVEAGLGNKTALLYLNENYNRVAVSYGELLNQVNKFANGLKSLGVKRGDKVVLYMPLVIEQVVAMLACARIGGVHNVVFGGFSAQALRERIVDSGAKVVITGTWTLRRGVKKDLKGTVDEAIQGLDVVEHIIVLQRDAASALVEKEIDFYELLKDQNEFCVPEEMDAEDPLFVLYTSGSTGKPKGVVHTTGGYSLYTHYTTKKVFDIRENDIYWCTADPGWITGHSYVVYGPLSNGVTSVLVEGVPDFPTPDHWYKIIEEQKVSIFYTSPTAIRMLRKYGEQYCEKHDFSSLRVLGTVGEPINPEVWQWYRKHIGSGDRPVEDTWWQTETGGHMIVTLPGLPQKPGKAGKPFFGIDVDVVNKEGKSVSVNEKGFLVIKKPWPSALRTCLNDHERFKKYWNEIKGVYFTGDFAIKDEDGDIQVLGRSDDVISVSGHRLGSAEIENALLTHPAVSEAAVIGKPDEIRGEKIKTFVVLKPGHAPGDDLVNDIKRHIKREIASMVVPDEIEFAQGLPKTRSGKIMRRVLKARELKQDEGDLSVLDT
ncbi:acetate--CoA ligase [Candidatus Kaiserbacteria bacterium RIFCSPLOWO2_01_FULL_54_13]|uniref:Acetate--CoA ligase n=1 Tax=Candidatus Kaiserbacteria bacterium RIFCSPLOWO2_01_FULL_54_13 TaxID=1798512 RepID=A0A1F6F0R9_9BACT|nr:MAG: acetate--CoA ligase [Candidatus Kaiserbacteria bacterium RIFCSPLOWO2_01_FULL_54_13]